MTKIIGFLGRKQAGKNTCSNMIHGFELLRREMINDFKIIDGKLWVLTSNMDGKIDWGEFDITRKDEAFVGWSELNMWPHVKNYSFADTLKEIAVKLFNIPEKYVYGNDDDKNTIIDHLLWENMPGVISSQLHEACLKNNHGAALKELAQKCYPHDSGPMTAREFLQFFGTEVGRKIWSPIWTNNTLNKIKNEKSEIAVISDVRFVNEVEAIKNNGGIVIKLNRKKKGKDTHTSETEIDLIKNDLIDFTINNNKKDYDIEKLQQEIKNIYDNIIL